jgi:aryl-alcohol dehydrogenase-like predicted oxidoreductase
MTLRSKLSLGTVQFGLDYGVTNKNGQVTISQARDILDCAKQNNIKTLDTASLYGNSEKVLGGIGVDDYQIITKTTFLKDDVDEVINNFYKSLENLNRTQVEGLLIHNIKDIENKQFEALFEKLNALKESNLVKKIGFSTYTPEQVVFLLANFDFDLIQVPFNVFDTRLIDNGLLQALKDKGVEIHIRSVFLQGLLLDFDSLGGYFSSWENKFDDYQKMVKDSGFSLLEYALNFVLNVEEIDKILVGVNNNKQLIEIVKASQKKVDNPLLPFSINDINLLNPSLWK